MAIHCLHNHMRRSGLIAIYYCMSIRFGKRGGSGRVIYQVVSVELLTVRLYVPEQQFKPLQWEGGGLECAVGEGGEGGGAERAPRSPVWTLQERASGGGGGTRKRFVRWEATCGATPTHFYIETL